jgi:hypothetical protein
VQLTDRMYAVVVPGTLSPGRGEGVLALVRPLLLAEWKGAECGLACVFCGALPFDPWYHDLYLVLVVKHSSLLERVHCSVPCCPRSAPAGATCAWHQR